MRKVKSWLLGFGLHGRSGSLALSGVCYAALGMSITASSAVAMPQQQGSIRGVVHDKDFEAPLFGAQVLVVETGEKVTTSDQGHYVFAELPPGRYTLIFSKAGYVRQVKTDVIVTAGELTDVDGSLTGEFTEMEEFVVQDVLQIGAGAEAAVLELRFESPALMDSVGSDLMSRAGASDAASALRLVAGATVKDGKSAVVRGLPDRYVSSQVNGVRVPSADEDKRAVELDQFPSAVIESIQVTKTFTPDQQGDASGGAVNVKLKGIPEETTFDFKLQVMQNTQVAGRKDFLTYKGGGVSTWGSDDGGRDPQWSKLGESWDGAVGVSEDDAPENFKLSLGGGSRYEFDNGITVGGFGSLFYERTSAFFDNGEENSYWVKNPGEGLTPKESQGSSEENSFYTNLFDVTQGTQAVQWGGLGTLGVESENHKLGMTFLYSRTAEDTATLLEDTRGKAYYFDEPGNPYDPYDKSHPGNNENNVDAAPYLRTETLQYEERTTGTFQLNGEHLLSFDEWDLGGLTIGAPTFSWVAASSFADLNQPDKRQFGTRWIPSYQNSGAPPFVPPFTTDATQYPYLTAASVSVGFLQRTWKRIEEDSTQLAADLEFPFEQWGGYEGYFKFGMFGDRVDRRFDQEIFSHNETSGGDPDNFTGDWKDFWSSVFPDQEHFIDDTGLAIDYDGEQKIDAWYGMVDLPLSETINVITGARVESTRISIENYPSSDQALYFPPGAVGPVSVADNPDDVNTDFSQENLLPSIAINMGPYEDLTIRASFAKTVARQTFKELTPILQQEYLGGPIFVGNSDLGMSSLENYDLRFDYTPVAGGLLSASVFHKYIADPIEYVQRGGLFTFTTPVNYSSGKLTGIELEARQQMGEVAESLEGLALGANATFIDSEVQISDKEVQDFQDLEVPMTSRDMTNAPEHLFNLYTTYEVPRLGTQLGLFYTVTGDTLVAGAGVSDFRFVPSIYATQYDTLNFSLMQPLGDFFSLRFQAKNLTNPYIQEVYRSEYTGDDVLKSTYTRGIEYTLSIGAKFSF